MMLDNEDEPFGSQSFVSAYADMRMWPPYWGPVLGTAVAAGFGGTGVGLDFAAGLAAAAGADVALGAAEEDDELLLVVVVSASPSPPQAIKINSMTAIIAGRIFFTLRNGSLDINPPGIRAYPFLFVTSDPEPESSNDFRYEIYWFGRHATETLNIYYSRLGYASPQARISQVNSLC